MLGEVAGVVVSLDVVVAIDLENSLVTLERGLCLIPRPPFWLTPHISPATRIQAIL